MKQRFNRKTINILITMLLFLVFVLCALFTVLIGGMVYENIQDRMESSYTGSVALNYIANKVRQGDINGAVAVREVDSVPVLELKQEINGGTYVTQIYYYNGYIRELFTDIQSGLDLSDGLEIIECEGLELEMKGCLIEIRTTGADGGSLILAVRSGEPSDEQEKWQ